MSGLERTPAAAAPLDPGVLVVGDLLVDIVAEHRDPLAAGSDTAARIRLSGGGSAANTAAWLASLGVPVRLLAAVGDDDLGRRARQHLTDAGVGFVGPVLDDAATGACVVLVGPDGERTMLPDRGANDRLPMGAVVDALDPLPGWLHLSGYTLLGEGSRNAGKAVLSAVLAAGCIVSIDAASAAPLGAVGADVFLAWVSGASLLFANDAEAEALGGVRTVLHHVGAVVVKHGSAGATWTDGTETVSAGGLEVDLVDPTGAGDAFAAGWIDAQRSGASVEGALAAGIAAGATAVTRHGARPA